MESIVMDLYSEFRELVEELQFIDVNCWIGAANYDEPFILRDAGNIIAHLSRICGIKQLVLSSNHSRFASPYTGNDELAGVVSNNEEALCGTFILTPLLPFQYRNFEHYIDELLKKDLKICRVFPSMHNFLFSKFSCAHFLNILSDREIPLIVWTREVSWKDTIEIAKDYPRLKIILEPSEEEAYWNLRYILPLLEECKNVYLEINRGHLYLGIDELISRVGADRLIFGTNFPLDDPNGYLMLIAYADTTFSNKKLISRENILRLLGEVR